MASKVYFTTFKTTENENLLMKLNRLLKTAGMGDIDFDDKFTAIKIHFGEYGNLAFLRPNYAKVVADFIKESLSLPIAIHYMSAQEKMHLTILRRLILTAFHLFRQGVMY